MRRFLVVLVCVGVLLVNALIIPSVTLGYYTNMPASVVLGQPDFVNSSVNTGGASASSMGNPQGVFSDGTRLFVTDFLNSRVLIWNKLPTINGTPADVVLGQPDFSGTTGNNGGISASTMNGPVYSFSDGTHLVVADRGNRRVLIWNSIPTRNQQPADVVVGQPDFATSSAGTTASKFDLTFGVAIYNGKLFIVDSGNIRVLIYNSIPTTNGASADVVVGQDLFTTKLSSPAANRFSNGGLATPRGIVVANNKLIVGDYANHRVLIFDPIPTVNGASASVVIGQPDFTSSTPNNGGVSCASLRFPDGLLVTSNGRLLIGDINARILIFNQIPTSNFQPADIVLGQATCATNTTNFGGLSASSFNLNVKPGSEINNLLYVADTDDNRVLIFPNTIITPQINLTTPPVSIGSGRYRLTGNVFMNNNGGTYGLQKLSFDVNGTDNGSINVTGGRSDTGGNSTYDFTYDFDPTVGNGSINNLTIKILASTFNADTNTLFYFLPFNFKSFNVANTKSQNFTFSVNKDQLQRVKDNLDHFEVWYRKNNTNSSWIQYISNISKDKIDTNGLVIATKTTNLTKFIGSYIFKVTAIDNWGNRQDSNYLYTAGTIFPVRTLTSYPSFGKSFVPLPSPMATAVPTIIPTTSPTYTPYVIPTEMPVTIVSPKNNIPYAVIAGIVIVGLLLTFILFRKKITSRR